jgi:hypothetical protein
MALPSSGAISLSQVSVELSRAANAQTSLGESAVRGLAGVATGQISLSNLWGKSSVEYKTYIFISSDTANNFTNSARVYNHSTDVFQNIGVALAVSIVNAASMLRSKEVGIQIGGNTPSVLGFNEVQGFVFATNTAINPSVAYPATVNGATGWKYLESHSYAQGGSAGYSAQNNLWKYTFSTQTGATLSATASSISAGAGVSYNSIGYRVGGYGSTAATTSFQKWDFSTETAGGTGILLKPGYAAASMGVGQTANTGFFAGGYNGNPLTYTNTITKLDFATDTSNYSSLATLNSGGISCSHGDKNHTFWDASSGTAFYNTADGIAFATETRFVKDIYSYVVARAGWANPEWYG